MNEPTRTAARARSMDARCRHANLVSLGDLVDDWVLDDLRGLADRNEVLEAALATARRKLEDVARIIGKAL